MIHISNSMAEEILIVLGDLRRIAFDKQDNRSINMHRRARLIETYLYKKRNEEEKKKRNIYAARL